jgi:hypothetical protein
MGAVHFIARVAVTFGYTFTIVALVRWLGVMGPGSIGTTGPPISRGPFAEKRQTENSKIAGKRARRGGPGADYISLCLLTLPSLAFVPDQV